MIALALGSPFVWSAPASAVPITDDDECVQVGDMYVQLLDFVTSMDSASYEVVDGILTVEVIGPATPHWNGNYYPSMAFWTSANCSSPTNALPVGDYQVCVDASSEDGTFGTYSVGQAWGITNATAQDQVLGEPFTLVRESPNPLFPGSLSSIAPFLDGVFFEEVDDDNVFGTLTFTVIFGIGACGGGSAPGGGGNYDIDWEYYRNRAAAGATALPNTL